MRSNKRICGNCFQKLIIFTQKQFGKLPVYGYSCQANIVIIKYIYIVYKHGVSIQDGRSYWRYTLHGMQRLHKSILLLLAESV